MIQLVRKAHLAVKQVAVPCHCVTDDNISISSASGQGKFVIPDSWPPAIMHCIKLPSDEDRKLALVPSVRNEIVRVLANNMFCHDPNPNKEFCTRVAKLLVKKFKFMRDIGENVSGYVSYFVVVFMLNCFFPDSFPNP